MSHRIQFALSVLLLIVAVVCCGAFLVVRRHEYIFLAAFDRAVRDCEDDRSQACAADACDEAANCTSEHAKHVVELRCLEAFRSENVFERIAAYFVLTESVKSVSPETLAAFEQIKDSSAAGSTERADLEYLLDHLKARSP